MSFKIKEKKMLSSDNIKRIIQLGISLRDQLDAVNQKCITPYDENVLYAKNMFVVYNSYIWQCKTSTQGVFDESKWIKLSDDFEELSVDDIKAMLSLNESQLQTLASIIADSEVRLDKTYSSSKIYTELQNNLDLSKKYTLEQVGKASKASYKVVTGTSEMTEQSYIYLVANASSSYDMYIVEDNGKPTKIGDTSIDLSSYYTKAEVDADFLKIADADTKFTAQTSFDSHINDTDVHVTKVKQDEWDAKLGTDNVDNALDKNSENPVQNKVVAEELGNHNLKTYTVLNQIGLSTGCTMSDILNALTDYSQITLNSSYIATSDRPLNSPSDELIIITRLWHSRISIVSTDRKGKMCTGLTSYNGTTVTFDGWRRLCTTTIANVSQTAITFNDTTNYKPESNHADYGYKILNGICYVQALIRAITPLDSPMAICNLPKPANSVRGITPSWTNLDPAVLGMRYGVYSDDSTFRIWSGTTGNVYMINFSYPVAES